MANKKNNTTAANDPNAVQFELVDGSGKNFTCEVLFTFESKEWKAHYMVYYPVDDPSRISCSRYIPEQLENGTLSTLIPITNDEEWDFVECVINKALSPEGSN